MCIESKTMYKQRLRYTLRARHRNGHGIHSPFLYNLITQLQEKRHRYYVLDKLNQYPGLNKIDIENGERLFRLLQNIPNRRNAVSWSSNEGLNRYLQAASGRPASEQNNMDYWDVVLLDSSVHPDLLSKQFEQSLNKIHENSVFVLNQPYKKAAALCCWKKWQQHSKCTASLDFYTMGILLFRTDLEKRNYLIRK